MKLIFTEIYKEIKKSQKIILVRHIGPDPDAVSSQMALKKSIELTFSTKKVYAIGASISKFKYIGKMDKDVEFDYETDLIIALDVPNASRIDGLDVTKFKNVIKIDHHPEMESFSKISAVDSDASSAAQLVFELIDATKLKINKDIAEKIFIGIVSDTHRFLFDYTTVRTYEVVTKLVKEYQVDTQKLYIDLYKRPLAEVRLMGYISTNLKVTANKFAYIIVEDEILKEMEADSSAVSNMINDYNNINEILVWMFISYDAKNKSIIKFNIRSRGPIINELSETYGGGGHKFASGIRLTDQPKKVDEIICKFDLLCKNYNDLDA